LHAKVLAPSAGANPSLPTGGAFVKIRCVAATRRSSRNRNASACGCTGDGSGQSFRPGTGRVTEIEPPLRRDVEPLPEPGGLPALIAHRGYAAHYPENTLPALEAAVAAGARFVEVDVQLSADAIPVLFHDRSLRRVCAASGAVHQRPFRELQRLEATEARRFGDRFAGTGLASLAQLRGLLEENPQVVAFVEAKALAIRHFGLTGVLDAIGRELEPVAGRCVLISFAAPLLAAARARLDGTPGSLGWHAIGGVIDGWRQRTALAPLRPEYLFCAVNGLPRSGAIGFPGARIAVYEVASAPLALDLHRRGVHMIETFAIGELMRELDHLMRTGQGPL
jgi:glycerophosphoryl diester phosphodiesterase